MKDHTGSDWFWDEEGIVSWWWLLMVGWRISRISSEAAKREGEENVSGTMNSLLEKAGKNEKQVKADDEEADDEESWRHCYSSSGGELICNGESKGCFLLIMRCKPELQQSS